MWELEDAALSLGMQWRLKEGAGGMEDGEKPGGQSVDRGGLSMEHGGCRVEPRDRVGGV